MSSGSSARSFSGRSNDDLFIIYTGGTTGMPKGVMWPHEAGLLRLLRRRRPIVGLGHHRDSRAGLLERAKTIGAIAVVAHRGPAHPRRRAARDLHHADRRRAGPSTSQRSFDAASCPADSSPSEKVLTISCSSATRWRARSRRPREERRVASSPHDCSSVLVIGSAGAIFSEPTSRTSSRSTWPNCTMMDNYGSERETGFQGKGGAGHKSFGQGRHLRDERPHQSCSTTTGRGWSPARA